MLRFLARINCVSMIAASLAAAQLPPSTERFESPETLVDSVVARFARRDTAGFARIYPHADGRELLVAAVEGGYDVVPGPAEVVRTWPDSALAILSGHLRFGNSGDETGAAQSFSGPYTLTRQEGGNWALARRVADNTTQILGHSINLTIVEAEGIAVVDTLLLRNSGNHGAALKLNHLAVVKTVATLRETVPYLSGGGILWLDLPPGSHSVVIEYSIDVSRDNRFDRNSAFFDTDFGHLRGQYYWHPMIDFDDAADVRIVAHAAGGSEVATDLLQSMSSDGTVVGFSRTPVGPMTLAYDQRWQHSSKVIGGVQFNHFATAEFEPTTDSLASAIRWTSDLLSSRFGSPVDGYLAVAQLRAHEKAGWPFMSNRLIAARTGGGELMITGNRHRAFFGHEVAHSWTHPTGPGRNFLSEGWATFAEAILLRKAAGADAEAAFWEEQRQNYLNGGFNGEISLLTDNSNGGVSYSKGAWVLRMLERFLGQSVFDQGVRKYVSIPAGQPSGVEEFIGAMNTASGQDVGKFLEPWLWSKALPEIRVVVVGDSLRISQIQDGPIHHLHIELYLVTESGVTPLTLLSGERETTVELPASVVGAVDSVIVDPSGMLLLAQEKN